MRTRTSTIAAIVAGAALAIAAPAALAQDTHQLARTLEQAIASGDLRAAEDTLATLWSADRDRAREMAWALLTRGSPAQQPIAAQSFAAHATAEELAQLAGARDLSRDVDTRALFARSLGARPGPESTAAARRLLRDREPRVRAAAVLSLIDLGDVAAIAEFSKRLKEVPNSVVSWADDEGSIEQMAMYAAVHALTDLNPDNASDVLIWVRQNRRSLGSLTPPPAPDPETDWSYSDSARELRTPSFVVQFDLGDVADAGAMQGRSGWGEISAGLEAAAEQARQAAAPLFGPVHLPPVRLVLANEQTIAQFGGPSRGYSGFASGNKIVMRFGSWAAAQRTLVHEYVHIIHAAQQEKQPRWLSEGLAESLSKSPSRSEWAGAPASARRAIADALRDGLVSQTARWDTGGASNEPAGLYAQGHAVIDYLRFGPFSAPETRLRALMGRLSRGETPERALEQLYAPMPQLDAGIRAWIDGTPP